jgi:hypothetical protein
MTNETPEQKYQGNREPNEDEIIKFPKIYYMYSYEADVSDGITTMPEQLQEEAMQRQDKSSFDYCNFRMLNSGTITIRDSLEGLHESNFPLYQKVRFPKGKIKLGFSENTLKGLTKVMFNGCKDHIKITIINRDNKEK